MQGWGIIGTGDISHRVVADLLAIAPGTVAAVWGRADERADEFGAAHGIGFATSRLAELLSRDDVDIVYIATPAQAHLEFSLAALSAGKHVLVEKPMATNSVETEEIFAAARAAGRFAMEAMWMRFNPLHIEVRDRILDGALGEVRSVRASFGTPFLARGNKLTPAHGGSALLDRGIYPVTLAQWFLGTPSSVTATGALDEGVDVSGHATLDFAGGAFAQIAWSGTEFLDLSAAISGERGWITLEPMFWAGSAARVHAGSADRIFANPEPIVHPRAGNGYRHMLTAVAEAVEAGMVEHPWHDRDTTVAVARTMDAIMHRLPRRPVA